ncbi:MAG: hypothetical protein C6Y22_19130 [Hapalosiphonaceae cyanobacterium JJU2]|nr:MAG: hypothetical protein C6Y22_19130 [Hapalosiphonaceae cyanobacterium JJU2]
MSNQIPSNENVTNLEDSYTDINFDSDIQDISDLEEASDESINPETINQDLSNKIKLDTSNKKTVIMTIQVIPNSETAIVSIGIKDAPPIIKTVSLTELTSHPAINNWLQELDKSLPEMLTICKQREEKQIIYHNKQEQPKTVQKRDLPESKDKTPTLKNQLSLF